MEIFLLYLGLGAIAGLISGLFGLGGGVVIVPILIFTFSAQGFSADVLTHMAIGTSLATIVITSISSVTAHHKRGAVLWPVAFWLTPGICVGAALGAIFAVSITGPVLQLGFGIFLCLVAFAMGLSLQPSGMSAMPGPVGKTFVGSVIGFVSSVFGIGGGSLSVPYFSWVQVSMKNAVATSAACGLPIAVSGAIAYALQGAGREGLPEGALGFVYVPAFVGIVIASTVFAKMGARFAHQLPSDLLKKGFAVLLLVIGLRFVWRNASLMFLG
ncbi:MAG: sulfite exporter TauE/SafE family protein [Porticoccus sp.]|nr:sulfite exporter TauE/SafE family protein [Porticoccus sp.]